MFYRVLNTPLRTSRLQMFFKIDVLKNFRKFHRNTLVLESLFNKVAGIKLFLQNTSGCCFLSLTPVSTEHFPWLFLAFANFWMLENGIVKAFIWMIFIPFRSNISQNTEKVLKLMGKFVLNWIIQQLYKFIPRSS